MPEFHAIVSGLVQGVSFRYYTVLEAKRLGLAGFVRNLDDGNVEVLAQGSKTALLELADWLKHGPSSASVKKVLVDWQPESEKFVGFSARP